jgi:hypothetical protein
VPKRWTDDTAREARAGVYNASGCQVGSQGLVEQAHRIRLVGPRRLRSRGHPANRGLTGFLREDDAAGRNMTRFLCFALATLLVVGLAHPNGQTSGKSDSNLPSLTGIVKAVAATSLLVQRGASACSPTSSKLVIRWQSNTVTPTRA